MKITSMPWLRKLLNIQDPDPLEEAVKFESGIPLRNLLITSPTSLVSMVGVDYMVLDSISILKNRVIELSLLYPKTIHYSVVLTDADFSVFRNQEKTDFSRSLSGWVFTEFLNQPLSEVVFLNNNKVRLVFAAYTKWDGTRSIEFTGELLKNSQIKQSK